MHSFQFFQYYPERDEKIYTIVTYPEIERDYFEFLKGKIMLREFDIVPPSASGTSLIKVDIDDSNFCRI